jgi:YHS domain-containing protein
MLPRSNHPSILCLALAAGVMTLSPACASPPKSPVATPNATEGLALHGYDPVAYFTLREATQGSPDIRLAWQGVIYQFASQQHREMFVADPNRYLPQYGGYCAIAMAWGRIADIDPESWAIVDQRLYLNASPFAHRLWSINRRGNIESANKNWAAVPKFETER